MPITIGSNISSLRAIRQLNRNSDQLTTVYERLSSGQRINKASDDAAGLALTSSLEADVRIFAQAIRNGSDAISVLNIAEGAVRELSNIVTRISELAEQSANGVYSNTQRTNLNNEADALREEYNRIVATTEFNGLSLLDGSNTSIRIQLGVGVENSIEFSLGDGIARVVGNGEFGNEILFSGHGNTADTLAGDFNGDGQNDLLFISQGINHGIYMGNGDGTFQSVSSFSTSGVVYASATVQAADYNQDGNLDISTMSRVDGTAIILLGNGNGTFQAEQSFTFSDTPNNLINFHRHGDLNNDGILDLVTADISHDSFRILYGNGDGTFSAVQSLIPGTSLLANSFALGDINSDGNLDIVGADQANPTDTQIYFGGGNGTFSGVSSQRLSIAGFQYGVSIEVADVDDDGDLDFLGAGSSAIGIALNDGTGTFSETFTVPTGSLGFGVGQLQVSDFDQDGDVDLIVLEANDNTVSAYLNQGNNEFVKSGEVSISSTSFLRLGDFNMDGVDDISMSGGSSISVTLQNTTTSPTLDLVDLTTAQSSRSALDTMRAALSRTSTELSNIGAAQSRFQIAISNLQTARENYQNAHGAILDANIASESADLVRLSILQQASSAILVSANQQPALALQLL